MREGGKEINMKKLFLFLLRRYSNTEEQRMEIYRELWHKTKEEYNEQTAFGNVYNMNIEVLMSNPFFESRIMLGEKEDLQMLKQGLSNSFDESVEFILKK
jgi:hypothetical protein